ncbi:MAG TPA: O-antigen ligase family protein [Thermoanaerobaculia bacterium]|jgi:O-antigen ligase
MSTVEWACAALLLVYLVWVPLPFGSNVDAAFVPLVVPPLVLCAVAALARARDGASLRLNRAYRTWSIAGLVVLIVVAIQLLPLPPSLLGLVSPESHAIWSAADRVTEHVARSHPITINPAATRYELFRLIALVATFHAAALTIYTYRRRIGFAGALCTAGVFEAVYAVREAATQHYEIWGWTNQLIFNRVSGTFVNPNHFAHYVAIVLPFAIYLGAIAWRNAANGRPLTFGRHVAALIERQLFMFSIAIGAALACIAAILLSQSRGALLSAVAGMALMLAAITSRHAVKRLLLGIMVLVLVIGGLAAYLGTQRTIARFESTDAEVSTLGGRRTGIEAALRVWRAFPLFGSGAGTFADVVSMGQDADVEKLYRHAHDDYAEAAATAGIFGVLFGAAFLVGIVQAFRRESPSWRARAFTVAALTSVTIAAVHALFDFNFYIPANAATLAAIAGAAVAPSLKLRPRESEASAPEPAD